MKVQGHISRKCHVNNAHCRKTKQVKQLAPKSVPFEAARKLPKSVEMQKGEAALTGIFVFVMRAQMQR